MPISANWRKDHEEPGGAVERTIRRFRRASHRTLLSDFRKEDDRNSPSELFENTGWTTPPLPQSRRALNSALIDWLALRRALRKLAQPDRIPRALRPGSSHQGTSHLPGFEPLNDWFDYAIADGLSTVIICGVSSGKDTSLHAATSWLDPIQCCVKLPFHISRPFAARIVGRSDMEARWRDHMAD